MYHLRKKPVFPFHKKQKPFSLYLSSDKITSGNIVNRAEWLWSPANIKEANEDAKIYVGRSTTVHSLLFVAYTLCMNYVTKTVLLVSSSVWSRRLLCFVHGQGQKSKQKHSTKTFVRFHNHSPLLTMVGVWKNENKIWKHKWQAENVLYLLNGHSKS